MRSRTEVNNFVTNFAYSLSKYIRSSYYDDFTLEMIKTDWNPSRRSSRGGIYAKGPGINIAMREYFRHNKVYPSKFYEYASYDKNTIFGGFYYTNTDTMIKAIVAHEVAHAVQFFEYSKLNCKCKPHGPIFKKFYKDLRLQFVNQHIEDQNILENKYNTRNFNVSILS